MQTLSLKHGAKSDHRSTSEIELERLERRLRTIQQALEILTGICATLPDPEPELEADGADEDDDEDVDVNEAEGADADDGTRRNEYNDQTELAC